MKILNLYAGVGGNEMQLTEGGVLNHKIMNEAQNLNIALNFLRSDKPPLLVRCCYAVGFLLSQLLTIIK